MVVRIPSDLRIAAVSGPMPRMSVIGYAIAASPLGAPLDELRKAGERNNGLVDRFGADLLADKADDVAADALYLLHAQPHRHHGHARAYHFAHFETAGLIAAATRNKASAPPSLAKSGRTCLLVLPSGSSKLIPTACSAASAIYSEIGDKPADEFVYCPNAIPALSAV
jgi:hypothetical protein